MDLISAKVEAAKVSREKTGYVFIAVDNEGECKLAFKHPGPDATAATYRNGSEVATPPVEDPAPRKKEKSKEPKPVEAKTKTKSKVKEKTKAGAKGKAKSAAKKDRKPAAMPEGKKKTLTIKAARALAKKGAMLYRASNGSPLGEYYLAGYSNQEKEIEFIVKDAK